MELLPQWLTRVDDAEARLGRLARPLAGLTAPHPGSGERWDAHEVWGHLAEFIEYWIEIICEMIAENAAEPVPFGRGYDDPNRLAGLVHGRLQPFERLWSEVESDLADLRRFLTALPPGADLVMGVLPDGSVKPMAELVEIYLIGHLEEHVAQLASLEPAVE